MYIFSIYMNIDIVGVWALPDSQLSFALYNRKSHLVIFYSSVTFSVVDTSFIASYHQQLETRDTQNKHIINEMDDWRSHT